MNTRQVAVQAFIYVVSLTLALMGAISFAGAMASDALGYVKVQPSAAIMLMLTGIVLLCGVHGLTLVRRAGAAALAGLAGWYLWRHGWQPNPSAPPAVLTVTFGLLGVAALAGNAGHRSRRVSISLAMAAIATVLACIVSTWTPALSFLNPGSLDHVRTAEMLLFLGAIATFLLARFPRQEEDKPSRSILVTTVTGVLVYVSTWLLLSLVTRPMQPDAGWSIPLHRNAAGYLDTTLLTNAILLAGLSLVVFLMMSQRLAGQARRNAAHIAVQRDTMALIARTEDLTAMLGAICTMVEKREPRAVCTIHGLSEDSRQLELLAAPTMPQDLRTRFATIDIGEGAGSCGTAAWRRDVVTVPDISSHPFWRNDREPVQAHGLRACYSHPVFSLDGKVLGTVAIYLPTPGLPTDEHQQLLASTAQFAAVAIERARARIQIQASEQRYRSLYAFNPDPVFSLDREGRFVSINPAGERLSNYTEMQLLGQHYSAIVLPEEVARAELHFQATLTGQAQHYETRGADRNGNMLDLEVTNMPIEIDKSIVGVFGIAKDVTERNRTARTLHERNQQLAHNANHDQLTGLPNRRLLENRLQQACALPRPENHGLAVVFFDLDGFKPINDSMGHCVGDQILMEVAHRMAHHVRPQDTVARLSGDEFVMVLNDLPPLQAELITQRTINALAQPYDLPQGVQHITSSAGIAYTEGPVEDPMQLVQAADLAMYKAKHEGRNNYQWHTLDMSRHVKERVSMRNDLQKALETGGLVMHYQPTFDRSTKKVVGIEALARWRHAERGDVPPIEFITVAEETGQIIALGAWALQTACEHHQWLRTHGLSDFGVAVNISPVQFQRSHFVQDLQDILARTGLPATCLELEITESVLLNSAEQAIRTLDELKKLGVRVSIDDFGTGFSSLSYLKNLPIDKMKIDRSFVHDVTHDTDDAAIARAIISMAHNLDIKVVAEGVETQGQLDFLIRNGCDEFQGYLLARPMPLDQLIRFLETRPLV